jgi:hypothetical protein
MEQLDKTFSKGVYCQGNNRGYLRFHSYACEQESGI